MTEVLQKIYDSLKEAIPETWISVAADVSDLYAIRLGFVGPSGKLFQDKQEVLERFLSLRSLYALTLLRNLGQIQKTKFDVSVTFLVSSLHVDMQASAGQNLSKLKPVPMAEAPAANTDPAQTSNSGESTKKHSPHKVAALIPGFDVLQSCSVHNLRSACLVSLFVLYFSFKLLVSLH